MLRVSAQVTETEIDLQGVNGDVSAAGTGVEYGAQLMQFAETFALRDEPSLALAREALLDSAGAAVLVDAAGVAANFQRMVRIADAMGIPVDDMASELSQTVRSELELTRFESSKNSLKST
jgi:hypothetical protein